MADAAITRSTTHTSDPAPVKKKRNNTRKPLADKNAETNESSVPPSPAKSVEPMAAKESNQPSPKAVKQTKASEKTKEVNQENQPPPKEAKAKQTEDAKKTKEVVKESQPSSFEKDLVEMQEKLEKVRLEKEKTEELLKQKDEILKKQEKLEAELKRLQKLKKPAVNLPLARQSKDKDQDSKKNLQLPGGEEAEAEAEAGAEGEQGTEEMKAEGKNAVGSRKSMRKKQVPARLNDYVW